MTKFTEYIGNLHIHSGYSDGAGSVSEIARSAQKAGLDFFIINDHEYMADDLHLEDEGYYGNVLALMGLEIGGRYNHYLAYDLKEMVKGRELAPQEVIDRVNAQGGFGFLAHPFEKGMPFSENSVAYTWNDLSVTGHTGICIWNFTSRWKERIKTPFHGLLCLLFKPQTLKGPSSKTVSFWDKLCKQKKVVAIGGSDSHGSPFRWGPICFTPLSYDYLLNTINVHLLLKERLPGDFKRAREEIYGTLREGRLFIAHENLSPARGFRFYYVSQDGAPLTMGEEKPFEPGTLNIEVPKQGKIRLFKDGILQKQWHGQRASYRVDDRGVYRVEVYYRLLLFGWRPWIFSNPIYLR